MARQAMSLAIFCALLCPGCSPAASSLRTAERDVRAQLKDAASGQFRNITVWKGKKDKTLWACGEVNAKNAFGALAGFQNFTVDLAKHEVTFGPTDTVPDKSRLDEEANLCDEEIAAQGRRSFACQSWDEDLEKAVKPELFRISSEMHCSAKLADRQRSWWDGIFRRDDES